MKILLLMASLLAMSMAHASSDYEEIIHYVGKGQDKRALHLLEKYLEENPPLFRSYLLLGTLYMKTGQTEKSIKALELVPEQEREGNYWFLKLNAYLKLSDRSEVNLRDMAYALDQLIEGMSYLPQGAGETLLDAAEVVDEGRIKKICDKFPLSEEPRCTE